MVKHARDLGPRSRPGVVPTAGRFFPARSPWTRPRASVTQSALFEEFRRSVLSEDRQLDRLVERSAYTPIADSRVDPDLIRIATEALAENLSEEVVASLVPSPADVEPELAELLSSGGADLRPASHQERVSVLTGQGLSSALLKTTTVKRSVAAQLLGVGLETIDQLAKSGAIVTTDEGLPSFQFTDDYSGLIPHLAEVLPFLPSDFDAEAIEEWFTTASEDFWLGDGPTSIRLWLCAGQAVDPVIAAAKSVLTS